MTFLNFYHSLWTNKINLILNFELQQRKELFIFRQFKSHKILKKLSFTFSMVNRSTAFSSYKSFHSCFRYLQSESYTHNNQIKTIFWSRTKTKDNWVGSLRLYYVQIITWPSRTKFALLGSMIFWSATKTAEDQAERNLQHLSMEWNSLNS